MVRRTPKLCVNVFPSYFTEQQNRRQGGFLCLRFFFLLLLKIDDKTNITVSD